MILFLLVCAKICPFKNGRRYFLCLANKLRKYCYGGLSPQDVEALRRDIFYDVQWQLTTAKLHAKSFKGMRNAFLGRDVVIVGAGPSVVKYSPMHNCVHIALNRACSLKEIRFDYLFAIDNRGIKNYYDDFASAECVKFVGDQGIGQEGQIPESVIATFKGDVRRYHTDAGHVSDLESRFAVDLETQVLGNFSTVAMHAMQFALYGRAKRIYLVGIDCSASGHFDVSVKSKSERACYSTGMKAWAGDAFIAWTKLKSFAAMYYPDTEIISINPVGLKGLFNDIIK